MVELNDKLEYKERIKNMTPEQRSIEVANMLYDLNQKVESYVGSGYSKRGAIISATTVTAIIVAICEALRALFER
jgi:hypothetical protein